VTNDIGELCVTVGYACNFKCSHCAVADKRGVKLTIQEKRLLVSTIKRRRLRALFFVGGETALYIEDINQIVSQVESAVQPRVRITTNGYFAETVAKASQVLGRFRSLSAVQLSYDTYHAKFLPLYKIKNLYLACRKAGISFNVALTIQSPLELVQLKDLKALGGFPVILQTVHPIGAARDNNLAYRYPSFDEQVLVKRCPNLGKMIYLCGEGFTVCCSYLTLQGNASRYVHRTIGEHTGSSFYKLISKNTFGEILKAKEIDRNRLLPEHSSPCNLCNFIFTS